MIIYFEGWSRQDLTSSRFFCFTQGQNGVGSGARHQGQLQKKKKLKYIIYGRLMGGLIFPAVV